MTKDIELLKALIQLMQIQSIKNPSNLLSQSAQILQLANAERAKSGLRLLLTSAALDKLAAMKSKDMVEKAYFSHQSPTYGSAFDMMRIHGVDYLCAGENLALDYNADHAHAAWMKSKAHQKNILNPNFKQIGIGIYPKDNGSFVYTQLFIG